MAMEVHLELLVGLREQLVVGLVDAAEHELSLTSRDFGSADCIVAARTMLGSYSALSLLEAVVVGLRFGTRGRGLDRCAVAYLLDMRVEEVEKVERSTLAGLSLVSLSLVPEVL